MNACPHCQQTYEDWVEFCFEDGTPLVARNNGRPMTGEPAHPDSTVPNGPLPGRASAAAARSLVAFEDDADDDPTVPALPPSRDLGTLDTEEMSLADAPTVELPPPPTDRRPPGGAAPRDVAPQVASGVAAPRRAAPQVTRAKATPERPATAGPAPVGAPHPIRPPAVPAGDTAPGTGWRAPMPLLVAGAAVLVLAGALAWALMPASTMRRKSSG